MKRIRLLVDFRNALGYSYMGKYQFRIQGGTHHGYWKQWIIGGPRYADALTDAHDVFSVSCRTAFGLPVMLPFPFSIFD